jgi:hypothetical protein
MKKIILSIGIALSLCNAAAQDQEKTLDQALINIDQSSVTSGVIYERALQLSNLYNFNREEGFNTANYRFFKQALQEMYVASNKKFRKLNKFDTIIFEESLVFSLFRQYNVSEEYIQGPQVGLGDFDLENSVITINESFFQSVLGTKIIKRFNWIIDFEKEKIYVVPIYRTENKDVLGLLRKMENIALAMNGKLIILKTNNANFKVGQIIKKIDGIEISEANLCDLEKLLIDKTSDWSTLRLEIK